MRFKDRVEVEFPENQVTLISGENGSGKTSLLDALSICLYGRTLRTSGTTESGFLNLPDLVNHATTNADILVEFENHGHNFVVTKRIGSGTKAELFEDGDLKAYGSKVYDYVRTVAIGLDREGFEDSNRNGFRTSFILSKYTLLDELAK